jgi:P27 family predicted phage terminase small subunit
MGARGPAPRPTNLTKFLGNPGHRIFNKTEPKPPAVIPECPDWLDERAHAEWDRVAQDLFDIGILTSVDRTALAGYCQAYSSWVECQEHIADNGSVIAGRWGPSINPAVTAAQKWMGIIRSFCQEFGLTPSSRARMALPNAAPEEDEDDGLD